MDVVDSGKNATQFLPLVIPFGRQRPLDFPQIVNLDCSNLPIVFRPRHSLLVIIILVPILRMNDFSFNPIFAAYLKKAFINWIRGVRIVNQLELSSIAF